MASRSQLDVDGTTVEVSNLDKVLYPKTGFTKGEVIDYYVRISPVLLPHLRDRPITLKRYPDGVGGLYFYEKECPSHRPKWVQTTSVARPRGGKINYCVINDLAALIWAANLADLELHTFLHKAPAVNRPTAVAFDLDPGPPADIINCCEVGWRLKAIFDVLGVESFPKLSGSKGPGVRSVEYGGHLCGYEAIRAGHRRNARARVAGVGGIQYEEESPEGKGSRRLEPERRSQDHRKCLLPSS